jgi:hypothetical protein
MRDPAGRVRFLDGKAIRVLASGGQIPPFLNTDAARALVQAARLVPYSTEQDRLVSPLQPFVSLPTEWCDAQLYDAARLTVEVAEAALKEGCELKDASAWNVIFDGCAPLFCDLFSFQPITSRQWWAMGQYCRHFLFPLLCASRNRMHGYEAFLLDRDGLTASRTRALLGVGGLLSRAAPALMASRAPASAPGSSAGGSPLHAAVLRYCASATPPPPSARSGWSRYTAERNHYSADNSDFKRTRIAEWMRHRRPAWVLDVGCNIGEFTAIAIESGAKVIALDVDHDCVQTLYANNGGKRNLYPIVANLADLRGGRGWAAAEFPSLLERLEGRADMLLMLAVVHHLFFSESIPLDEIVALCARLTHETMVVEIVDAQDPLSRRLASQRARDTNGFSAAEQMAAFCIRFDVLARAVIPGTARELVMFRKKA